jgi:hypothetical protein
VNKRDTETRNKNPIAIKVPKRIAFARTDLGAEGRSGKTQSTDERGRDVERPERRSEEHSATSASPKNERHTKNNKEAVGPVMASRRARAKPPEDHEPGQLAAASRK